jgi:hypothetical protein
MCCSHTLSRLFFLLLVLAAAVSAQFKAGLQGSITDANGAAITGATVTLTNLETARVQQTTAGGDGFYRFSSLAPGRYKLTVELSGFKKKELTSLEIGAEVVQGIDVTLEAGAVTDTVTIDADATPPLQTENANIDRGLTSKEIRRLPQFGRDPYELARLAPGVFGQGARSGSGGAVNLPNTTGPGGSNTSIFQTENVVPISANGQRVSANNFTIDGVSVNSLGWGGAAIVTPNQESVKEIRVVSTSYSAEDGRNSGAQIKVISQNGTNEFHGSALFKYNDPGLNSFNKWGGIGGTPTADAAPVRVENKFRQFGGSFGGPVLLPRFGQGGKAYYSGKNKLFFFFSFEGLRERTNNTYNQYIETEQYQQLIRTQRPNSVTARILAAAGAPRIVNLLTSDCSVFGAQATARCRAVNGGLDLGSPVNIAGANPYVTPQIGGGFDGVPDVIFAQLRAPNRTRGDQYNLRFDYNLNEKHNFAFSTYRTQLNNFISDTAGRSRETADLRFKPLTRSAMLTWNYAISPRLLNEARGNFTRFFSDQAKDSGEVNFGIPRLEVEDLPFDRIRFGAPRGETTPAVFAQNTFDFRDTLSIAAGNWALKYGVEIRREQNNNNLVGGARPLYSFAGLWNLANDAPIFEAINADPRTGQPANAQRYFRQGDYSLFGQHDWKARPNLMINLGLRYEYYTPLREARGQLSNLFPGANGFVDSQLRVVSELYNPDRNNFAPRIGFAFSPKWFKDKLVWRGGGGLAYNRVPSVLFGNTRGNPPFMARFSICCGNAATPFVGGQIRYVLGASNDLTSYPVNPLLSLGIDPATGGITGRTVEIYGTPQDQPNAYVYNGSLEAQYQLPWELTATLGYSGSAGHKLIRIVNQNFIFARNPRFAPVFFLQPDVNSNFHALNTRLSKRFSQGLQFDAGYRWSKSIDTLSFEGPGAVTNQTNPSNLASERGPSDFDATHYFTLSALYDLPIFRAQKSLAGKVLGGWQLSGIVTRNTGFPWMPKIFQNLRQPSGETFGPTRPTIYRGGALNDSSDEAFMRVGGNFPGGGATYFNTAVVTDSTGAATLALNPPGIGRNSFRGPQYFSVDLSAHKQFAFPRWEAARFEVRANFFNAFNMLNLQNLGFSDTGVNVANPNFGRSLRGLAGRVIEFQGRFSF